MPDAAEGKKGGEGGGRLGAAWGQERSREGGSEVRRRVSRHGTGAAAPGRSDSGGRRTSTRANRGCGWCARHGASS
jgi:hypothetical protein